MDSGKHILVFGAGGTTGRHVVERALNDGHRVRAVEKGAPPDFVRPEIAPPDRLEAVAADVLRDELDPLVEGVDAVISAMGVPLSPRTVLDPPPLYTEGALRMTRAMKAAGLRRLVVISASFAANRHRAPLWFQAGAMPALWRVYDQMADMERLLRATDAVDWTAVRPGWLLDRPFTGDYTVAEDAIPRGTIRTRHADLAHFILRCATTDDWVRKTPAIARREALRYSGPHALLNELSGLIPLQPGRRS